MHTNMYADPLNGISIIRQLSPETNNGFSADLCTSLPYGPTIPLLNTGIGLGAFLLFASVLGLS